MKVADQKNSVLVLDEGAERLLGRSRLLFGEGESSLAVTLLYLNGSTQVPGTLADAVQFEARDPQLRDMRDFADPDPSPKPDSPTLADKGEGYIRAFGRQENWREWRTVFATESVHHRRNKEDSC